MSSQQTCGPGEREQQRSCRCGKHGIVQRRLDTKRNRHGRAEQEEQDGAAYSHPSWPDTKNQQDAEGGFSSGGRPRQERDGERRHEGINLSHIACKVGEVSPACVLAPETKTVSNGREKSGAERDSN